MPSIALALVVCGLTYLAAILTLVQTEALLGSPVFFATAAVMIVAFVLMLVRVWQAPPAPRALLMAAFVLAVAFRIPPAMAPVGPDNDMIRYLWDGRVQQLGLNPYHLLPGDPALAHTHTDETRNMPSQGVHTPYPPAAQFFFRLIVWLADSARAMKLALLACDVVTIVVVWRWLVVTRRNEWLALAYAWNPLVVLEVAHSGHIDALGALWIAASAYWLARRWTALASIAFVLAVATKLLPVVLAPLFWRRIRVRDAVLGAALMMALYLPFMAGPGLPVGALPGVVAHIRFNGPLFQGAAGLLGSQGAAALAVLLGVGAAAWARRRLPADDPAAWAWPMALALLAAPVIYPWYLLYVTPFLLTRATWPLLAWSLSILPTYIVWQRATAGAAWVVPLPVLLLEYGVLLAAIYLTARYAPASGDGSAGTPADTTTAPRSTPDTGRHSTPATAETRPATR
jgi:alpha-1,6-mannosyltransferase